MAFRGGGGGGGSTIGPAPLQSLRASPRCPPDTPSLPRSSLRINDRSRSCGGVFSFSASSSSANADSMLLYDDDELLYDNDALSSPTASEVHPPTAAEAIELPPVAVPIPRAAMLTRSSTSRLSRNFALVASALIPSRASFCMP